MKWILVAIMATMYDNGDIDIYAFTDPTFDTVDECLVYAQTNPRPIISKLLQEYNGAPLLDLLCVTEEQLKKALEPIKGTTI